MSLLNLIGILAFVVALLISVMLHELGHFLTARKFGMKVTEFFLGFGPKIWSTQRGETEFGVKSIPAGGYCRIVGMSPSEPVDLIDQPRSFYKASTLRRLIVLGAGSTTHFVIGFLLLFTFFAAIGTPAQTQVLDQILKCIPADQSRSTCLESDPKTPALLAGLKSGDKIVSVNGNSLDSWKEVSDAIRNSPNQKLNLGIERDGASLEISLTPTSRAPIAKLGEVNPVGIIGVLSKVELDRSTPLAAITNSLSEGKNIVIGSYKALFALPAKIPDLIQATFGGGARDPEGLVGVVGVARVSGDAAASENAGWAAKIGFFLLTVASLNIFIGLFNLLPLLPLDGGHMAIAIVDGVRRQNARLRKLPTPEPFDVVRLVPLTLAVIVVMGGLSLLLLAADIINPLRLNF
jgi:membrane-associated protease RseP (regulator of RpoE activity)